MKSVKLPLILSFCLLASAAVAARTDEGTWSLSGSLMIDTATYVGTDINADLHAGNYIRTGLLVGGYIGAWDNDLITTLEGGASVKYHVFDNFSTPFSPFIGADLGLLHCSTSIDDAFALVLGARVGLDFFLTETIAVETALDAHVATDDVYTDDGDELLTNNDFQFKVGLAIFF
ncbi:MAG: hypothetical protein ACOX9C_00745 [Kiritimatiellia bacterium]|jgi:hypothetical protein